MALFECPECGGKVSDKATLCPHCGCPVKDSLPQIKTCPECGQEVDVSERKCPNCAFPFIVVDERELSSDMCVSQTDVGLSIEERQTNEDDRLNYKFLGVLLIIIIAVCGSFYGHVLVTESSSHMAYGNFSNAVKNRYVGGRALKWGGIGAGAGSVIPGIGTFVGAGIGAIGGGIYGYFKGKGEYEKEEYKKLIARKSGTELILKGDYTKDELKGIANQGKAYIKANPFLMNKILEQEGVYIDNIDDFY